MTFTRLGDDARARSRSIVFADPATDASDEAVDRYVSASILEHCVSALGQRALRLTRASPHVFRSTIRYNHTSMGPEIPEGTHGASRPGKTIAGNHSVTVLSVHPHGG